MPMTPVLQWDLFPPGEDHKLSQQKLLYAYEAMVRGNQEYLEAHPSTPLLYESGVRYQVEPPGHEDWADIPNVIRQGWGDCEDLGGWLTAELRQVFKIPAKPFLRWRRSGNEYHYHALLILPAYWIWDFEIVRVRDPSRPGGLMTAINPQTGGPVVRRCRRPIYEKPGGGFVFEDPSARLGMYGGQTNVTGAYREIVLRGQDPLKIGAEAKAAGLRRRGRRAA